MVNEEQIPIIKEYQNRLAKAKLKLEEAKKLSLRFSLMRLAIVLLAIPILYFLAQVSWIMVVGGIIVLIAIFIYAVLKQQSFDREVIKAQNLIKINENEIDALEYFQNIYYDGEEYQQAHHLYTDDLDIFGSNSLFALINRATTYYGNRLLAKAFTQLPSKDLLEKRQEVIKELAPQIDWRQSFSESLFAIEGGHKKNIADAIEDEMNLDLSFATGKIITFYRRSLIFVWPIIIGLYFVNISMANTIGTFFFLFNLMLTFRKAKETGDVQGHLSKATIMLRSFSGALKIIFSKDWSASLVLQKVSYFKGKGDAVKIIEALRVISDRLDYRLNLIPAIILNGFFLWDYYVLSLLENWKKNHDGQLKELFEFIGEIEAFSALSTWAYNYPQYSFPEVTDDYFHLEAQQIKHPLIPEVSNVANDFKITEGAHLSIITGSNMSGKSTFLRTIGINMILGYSGTKVAASYMSLSLVKIISYMRIKDILEESVSTFKAELNRISLILDALQKGEKCFILIDEMLRGTNSKDKLAGSIGIAKRLLKEKTYAMIATHDIKLAELGNEISEGIVNYYFDIDYAEGDLVFDYQLKKGICENFNATFLLEKIGIAMDDAMAK